MKSQKEITNCKRKTRFANDFSAQEALKKINPQRKLKRPYRAYRCSVCHGYHLTSSPKR